MVRETSGADIAAEAAVSLVHSSMDCSRSCGRSMHCCGMPRLQLPLAAQWKGHGAGLRQRMRAETCMHKAL